MLLGGSKLVSAAALVLVDILTEEGVLEAIATIDFEKGRKEVVKILEDLLKNEQEGVRDIKRLLKL